MTNPYGYAPSAMSLEGDDEAVSEAESGMDEADEPGSDDMEEEPESDSEDEASQQDDSENADDEETLPYDEFRGQLEYALDSLYRDGSFSWSTCEDNAPNPGLEVDRVGLIGLPLSDRDAKALLHKGSMEHSWTASAQTGPAKTIVWELPADELKTTNPAWGKFVDKVTKQAHTALGVAGEWQNVSARLDRLQIYKQHGNGSQSDKMVERVPGMFGTLAITLPVKHDKGVVILKHLNKIVNVKTAEASDFSTTCAAWYDDVSCEMFSQSSGHKIVLVYKLDQIGTPNVPQAPKIDWTAAIKTLLTSYDKGCAECLDDYQSYLLHKIQHSRNQPFRIEDLIGKDKRQVEVLQQVAEELNYGIYLAALTKEIEICEDSGEEEDRHESIDSLTTLDGRPCSFKPQLFKKDNYTTTGYTTDDEEAVTTRYEDRDYDHYDGIDTAIIHTYKHFAVVLVPPRGKVAFAMSSRNKVEAALAIFDDVQQQAMIGGPLAVADLHIFCNQVVSTPIDEWSTFEQQSHNKSRRAELTKKVAAAALKHNWDGLYGKLPLDFRREPENVRAVAAQVHHDGIDRWQSTLQALLDVRSTTQDRWDIICTFWAGFNQASVTSSTSAGGVKAIDPAIQMLANRAATDLHLKELMKVVAQSRASTDQLRRFQAHVDEANAAVKRQQALNHARAGVQQWLNSFINQLFTDDDRPTKADALSLSRILQGDWSVGVHANPQLVETFIAKAPVPALVEFVLHAEESTKWHGICDEDKRRLLNRAIEKIWTDFAYTHTRQSRSTKELRKCSAHDQASMKVLKETISFENLKALIKLSDRCDIVTTIDGRRALDAALSSIDADYVELTMIPFVRAMLNEEVPALTGTEDVATGGAIINYVNDIFFTYIKKCVGPEPTQKTNWRRPQQGCKFPYCTECKEIAAFMASTKRQTFLYHAPKSRRHHLQTNFANVEDAQYRVEMIEMPNKRAHKFIWKCVKHHERSLKQHEDWQTKHGRAQETVKNVASKNALKVYLGDNFDAIMSCRVENLAGRDNPRKPLEPASANVRGQDQKRRLDGDENAEHSVKKKSRPDEPEIVDLTDA